MYKIIFFDIDGTLLVFQQPHIRPKVIEALNACHQKGIKLFLSTGRPNFCVPDFPEVPFDGVIGFNGGYCATKDEVIYKNPILAKDVQTLVANCKKHNRAIQLATATRMGANQYDSDLAEYFQIGHQSLQVTNDFYELSKQEIFQGMMAIPPQEASIYLEGCNDTKIVYWWDKAGDIIPLHGGKDIGVQKVLEYYGYRMEEAMAFGDGGNDIPMLQAVGMGIAMGNATNNVKDVAHYVTDDVQNDGIETALRHFHVIP